MEKLLIKVLDQLFKKKINKKNSLLEQIKIKGGKMVLYVNEHKLTQTLWNLKSKFLKHQVQPLNKRVDLHSFN